MDRDPLGVGPGLAAQPVAADDALDAEVLVVRLALRALAAGRPRQHRDAVALAPVGDPLPHRRDLP
jgi:hypothetical protein